MNRLNRWLNTRREAKTLRLTWPQWNITRPRVWLAQGDQGVLVSATLDGLYQQMIAADRAHDQEEEQP